MVEDRGRKNSGMRLEEGESERKKLKEECGVERRKSIRRRCEKGATDRSLGLIAPFCGLAGGNMMQTET